MYSDNPPPTQVESDLVREVAKSIYDGSQSPNWDIALAGAIAFISGITGRAYTTPTNAGINQYILMLGPTGLGKDAVSKGTSRLMTAVRVNCPCMDDFKGPGELVSSAGLIKWLERKPCIYSVLGEFGITIKQMSLPNANANLVGLKRTLLQMYSKSGAGEVFDPMAYSDREKNTAPLHSPSLTIFGESVPESFYESLDETMIGDGLLPRFMVFETKAERPYRQESADTYEPPQSLITKVTDLASYCHETMHLNKRHRVAGTLETKARFDEFDRSTTDKINGSTEVPRQLWNRGYLKALKLATVRAIGRNYLNPVIGLDDAVWAIDLVTAQTENLIAKFENNEVGEQAGNDSLQVAHIKRVIAELFIPDSDKAEKYGANNNYLNRGVIEYAYIWRRLATLKAYQPSAKQSIPATLKLMVEMGWLGHVPNELKVELGTRSICYLMTNPAEFAKCDCVKDKMQFISSYIALLRL